MFDIFCKVFGAVLRRRFTQKLESMGDSVRVYMIGNAHIDPVWLWRWQEGLAETLATCRSALDRMDEFPDFVFTRADAATYRWIEQAAPDMFEDIKRRVAEGRWSVVGGWWEQADCNIPCGESFVRHELYGKRYFGEEFGIDVSVGYNVDSFGHNAGLPQILAKAGIGFYVFMRPGVREKELPGSVFIWEGRDGSRVLAHRLLEPYCTGAEDVAEHIRMAIESRLEGSRTAACFYGVGNHGGGPTRESIELILSMQRDNKYGAEPVFGTLEQFFGDIESEKLDLPIVRGDLQHHAVGCYTAHIEFKRLNHRAECRLIAAEKYSAMAKMLTSHKFPKDVFAEAWRSVLFNQFHDVLAGTSIEPAYDDARDEVGGAIAVAEREIAFALAKIAGYVNTQGEGSPYVVFNPNSFEVVSPIFIDSNLNSARDINGRMFHLQKVSQVFESTAGRDAKVFVDSLPAFGWKLYYLGDWNASVQSNLRILRDDEKSSLCVSNGLITIVADDQLGAIKQIRDERLGCDLLRSPVSLVVMEDLSDTWSHGVERFDKEIGRFVGNAWHVVENGSVRTVIRSESSFGDSRLWTDVLLYDGLPYTEVRIVCDWHEKHKMLKFELPFDLKDVTVETEASYAFVLKDADGVEEPCQRWVSLMGECGGSKVCVSVINDGTYGYDAFGGRLRMSLVRSPIYAFHDPRKVEFDKYYRYLDQGLHSWRFIILPSSFGFRSYDTIECSATLNIPPEVVETYRHNGILPAENSLISVDAPNVIVCVVKECEDDDSIVVRMLETCGNLSNVVLNVFGHKFVVHIEPWELKTFKIVGDAILEVDLLERSLSLLENQKNK